jgi:hypothetical protein
VRPPLVLPVRNDAASSAKDGVAEVIVEAAAVSLPRITIGASTDCIALLAERSGGDRLPEEGT